jgi:PAS domain S-box-containing protein
MMDNTFDHIYFKDTKSRFLRINRAQAAAFGLSDPEEALGKTDHDFFSEEHARQAQADEQKILTSDQPFMGLEEKETWPDGRETWVSTMKLPFRDREGRIIGTFGISRDISERKAIEFSILETNRELEKTNAALKVEIAERRRVEAALAFERDLFRTMMDNTSDHIYFKDSESRFILMNRSLAISFGLTDPSEAVGKTDFDFFTEEHARQAYNDEQQIKSGGRPLVGVEEKET